jgi:hypothetical protein
MILILMKTSQGRRGQQRTQRLRAIVVFAVIAVLSASVASAQAVSKTRTHVETLASPRLEGRLAGSNGEKLASDYIAAELQKTGAKPLPGKTALQLPFEFTAGTKDGGSSIAISGTSPEYACATVSGGSAAPCVLRQRRHFSAAGVCRLRDRRA